MERHSGAGRAGEQQAVDPRLSGKRAPLVRAADEQPDHAVRDLRFMEAVDQEFARCRGFLRGFEHDRVAGDQSRYDVPVGQVRGEVVRPEHGEHAMGFVAHRDAIAEVGLHLPLGSSLGISVDRDFDLVDDGGNLSPRLPQRLAGFAGDQLGELGILLSHDIGEAADGLDAVGCGMCGPGRPRGARRGDFGGSIPDLARPDFGNRGRIGRRQHDARARALHNNRSVLNLPVHPVPLLRPSCGPLQPCH